MKRIASLLALCLLVATCSEKKMNYDDIANYKRVIFHLYTNPTTPSTDTTQVMVRLQVYVIPGDSGAHRLIGDTILAHRHLAAYGLSMLHLK